MNIESGMIGFSGGNKFMQKCIRFFTGSKFSHSFTVIDVGGIPSALETTETRITVTPIDLKLHENNYVQMWTIVADKELKDQNVLKSYSMYSGEWYGYKSYLWFMYRWLSRKFNVEQNRMWDWAVTGITCTELTCMYISELFPDLFTNDLNTYSPEELRNIMINNPDKFVCMGWYKE
jgi:hypothetical protein